MIDFEMEKGPKMNIFHFGAFQEKMHMRHPHMLFGVSQGSSRITAYERCSITWNKKI